MPPTPAQVDKLLRDAEPKTKHSGSEYVLGKGPQRYIIAGASGSGKSYSFARYACSYGTTLWDAIYYIAPTRTLQGDKKLAVYRKVWGEFYVQIPCDNNVLDTATLDKHLEHAKASKWHVLVVFDDLLQAMRHPMVTSLYISGRHDGISVATLCQSLWTGNKTARLNASVFWLHSMSERREVAELAQRLTTDKSRARMLSKCYDNVISRNNHGSVIICLDVPSTPELPLRVRDSSPEVLVAELWKL